MSKSLGVYTALKSAVSKSREVNLKTDHKSYYLRKKRKRREKKEKKCFRPGSNRRPCASSVKTLFESTCEAHVITTTLRKPLMTNGGNFTYLIYLKLQYLLNSFWSLALVTAKAKTCWVGFIWVIISPFYDLSIPDLAILFGQASLLFQNWSIYHVRHWKLPKPTWPCKKPRA